MKKSKEGKELINKIIHTKQDREIDFNKVKQKIKHTRKYKERNKKIQNRFLYNEKKSNSKFATTSERSVKIDKICTKERSKGKRILTEQEANNLLQLSNKFTAKYKCGNHWHLTSK